MFWNTQRPEVGTSRHLILKEKESSNIHSCCLMQTHDSQAPWPGGVIPSTPLPTASLVTIVQLAHVCALVGLINFFVLRAVRSTLSAPHLLPLQEKIVRALLIPLVLGDVFHVGITLWALDASQRWDVSNWSPLLTTTIVMGFSLLVPRVMWHAGIGRYVDSRDGLPVRETVGLDERKKT